MQPSRFPLLSVTPAVLSDARALVAQAELAAVAPENLRRLAWAVLISSRGGAMRQRRMTCKGGGC